MEQFSLDKWLENPSRRVVTRSGHNVRILCTDQRGNMPIVAIVEFETLDGVFIFYSDGKNESHREYDLFFADEDYMIRKKFINALKEVGFTHFNEEFTVEEAISWLENQGSITKLSKEICLTCKEYSRGYQEGLKLGREDALKDLPKWKKVDTNPAKFQYNLQGKQLYKDGEYYIDLIDLETLPKEE